MKHDERIEASEPPSNEGVETEVVLSTSSPFLDRPTVWRWSLIAKITFMAVGVVLPILCFAVALFTNILMPSWQSGQLGVYASLLLKAPSAVVFFPFLLYCMMSMTAMVFRPAPNSKRFWVRLGIYSGVLLAFQYHLVLSISAIQLDGAGILFFFLAPVIAAIIWLVLYNLVLFFQGIRSNPQYPKIVLLSNVFLAFLIATFVAYPTLFFILIIVPFFFATSWCILAYATMTWHLLHRHREARWQFSLAQLLAVVGWVAAYCGSWRWSINLVLVEYAKLPTEAPHDCYVATAAARGHRRLVGTQPVNKISGQTFLANNQMRYLKAAELVLKTTCPTIHLWCRAVYDRLGPRLASWLVWPVLADVAYLALKPAEWTARGVLLLILPGGGAVVRRLYRG